MTDRSITQSPSKFGLLFPNTFYGLLPTCIQEINPQDLEIVEPQIHWVLALQGDDEFTHNRYCCWSTEEVIYSGQGKHWSPEVALLSSSCTMVYLIRSALKPMRRLNLYLLL